MKLVITKLTSVCLRYGTPFFSLVVSCLVNPALGWEAPCSSVFPCKGGDSDNNCQLGSSSSGRVCIGLSVATAYRIWGLENIIFSDSSAGLQSNPGTVSKKFCVFSNAADGGYRLTVGSVDKSKSGGGLTLTKQMGIDGDTGGEPLSYHLAFSDADGSSLQPVNSYGGAVTFNNGCASNPDSGATCASGNVMINANLASSISKAAVGDYSDVLVLTVGPEM